MGKAEKQKLRFIKTLIWVQGLILVLGSLTSYIFVKSLFISASFALGAGLVAFNIIILLWLYRLIFTQKSIALAGTVIVLKYLFLGVLLFFLIAQARVHMVAFFIGMASFLVPVIIATFNVSNMDTAEG